MTHRLLRHLLHSGLVLVGILFLGAFSTSATRTSDDLDLDGYIAQEVGGDDCLDSLQAAFMTNGTTCNPAVAPTFLESKNDPDTDDDIADHAWIQDDGGLYHLYFQTEDQGSGDFLEHYTSTDLKSLTYVGPVLQPEAGHWDSYGLWAPAVVKNPVDGFYYLFYSGVTGPGSSATAKQRIGVATSSDLVTWTKAPVNNCPGTTGDGCVYECDEPWTRWSLGQPYDAQCRDPMVIWDSANSRWLMVATALMNVGTWSQGVTAAVSTDLINWTGAGYIKAAKKLSVAEGGVGAQLSGGVAENPFITKYDGDYFLFFTDTNDPEDYWTVPNPRTMIQYASSPSLSVDASGSTNWTYRGSTRDPGVNAPEFQVLAGDTWVVSHSISPNPYSGYWGSHTRDLRLKRIVWEEDGTFTTANLWDLACRVPSDQIHPAMPEVCGDGLDNDCANGPDDAVACGVCVDNDADGYGTSGLLSCPNQQRDCNDTRANVNPGAPEICDVHDNDCDGLLNEGGVCRKPKPQLSICEDTGDPDSPGACYIYN